MIRSLLDRQQYSDGAGLAAALGISSAAWPMFGLLWPSGAQLAAHMVARPPAIGRSVLEIGCGLALASLACHRLGMDITASDRHPLAESFLHANLALNRLGPLRYRHGDWAADPAAVPGCRVTGLYDLIIGSDLLYERDDGATLAAFIGLHSAAAGEVRIVDPDRETVRPSTGRWPSKASRTASSASTGRRRLWPWPTRAGCSPTAGGRWRRDAVATGAGGPWAEIAAAHSTEETT